MATKPLSKSSKVSTDFKNVTFSEAMSELESLNDWFVSSEIDLEEGLEKLKRGKDLIAFCMQRLNSVENEFSLIQAEFDALSEDSKSASTSVSQFSASTSSFVQSSSSKESSLQQEQQSTTASKNHEIEFSDELPF